MARTFDFIKETYPAKGYRYGSKQQEQIAKKYKVERVLPFRFTYELPKYRFTYELPKYILQAAKDAGYVPVLIGYTTPKSTTWGFYKQPVVKPKWLLIKAVPVRGGFVLEAENGERPMENYLHRSRIEAYDACRKMYPSNSVWEGKKVGNGYRIKVN